MNKCDSGQLQRVEIEVNARSMVATESVNHLNNLFKFWEHMPYHDEMFISRNLKYVKALYP